jgi:hypothetical protein
VDLLVPPPEAVIETVVVPGVALVVAENDTVSVQVGLHGLLLKIAVTPVGRPDAEKLRDVVVPETNVAVVKAVGLVLP